MTKKKAIALPLRYSPRSSPSLLEWWKTNMKLLGGAYRLSQQLQIVP
ncbi:unnamed protein product, partial [Linum tenue]